MTPGKARRSSLVIAMIGLCMLVLSQPMLPTLFCGGTAVSKGTLLREGCTGSSTACAKAESERVTASSETSLEISEPLRFASGVTGLLKPVLQAQANFAAGDYDQENIRGLIESESKSANLVMYTLSQSPFSIEAKRLLNEASIQFKEIEIAPLFVQAEGENAAKRAELGRMTGRTSMPHIFINGESIGGLYEGTPGLVPLIESGKLEAMVRPKESNPLDGIMGMFR